MRITIHINLILGYILYVVFQLPFTQDEYNFLMDSEGVLTSREKKLIDRIVKINGLKKRGRSVVVDRQVICTTNKSSIDITRGSIYTVLEETIDRYLIKSDNGENYWYLKGFFIDYK